MSSNWRKKLIIRVDANDTIGYGHYYRCLSIALMLSGYWDITFAVSAPSEFLKMNIQDNGFKYRLVESYRYVDPDSRGEETEVPFDLSKILTDEYQSVLVDGYFFGKSYFEQLSKFSQTIYTISDNTDQIISADVIINSAPQAKVKDYDSFNAQYFALGTKYLMLRPEFILASSEPIKQRLSSKLLICFGGADHFRLTEKVTRLSLTLNSFDEIHLISRIGNSPKNFAELIRDNENLIVHYNLSANQIVTLMRTCSLAILPSSGLLYEAIACGLPVVTCWYAKNQKSLHDFLVEQGNFPTFGYVKDGISIKKLKDKLISDDVFKFTQMYLDIRRDIKEAPHNYLKLFEGQM